MVGRSPMERMWQTAGLSADEVRARFDILVATAASGIVVADEMGHVQLFNPMCERLFGYSAAEIVGKDLTVLLEGVPALGVILRPENEKGENRPRELTGRRKDGTVFPILVSMGEGT